MTLISDRIREAGFEAVLRSFPQGALIVFDHDLRYVNVGGLGLSSVGLTASMLEGKTVSEAFEPQFASTIEPSYRLALAGQESTSDVRFANKEYVQRLAPLRDATGAIIGGIGCVQEMLSGDQRIPAGIGGAVDADGRLRHSAAYDPLTGLPNRALLVERMFDIIDNSHRDGAEIFLLYGNLDDFKHINELAGRNVGDSVLRETAHRIQNVLGAGDTLARVGGDEFVIVLSRSALSLLTHQKRLQRQARALALVVAQRVSDSLRPPIAVNGLEHAVTISFGIAGTTASTGPLSQASPETTEADQLLRAADAAMHEAKRRGKNGFVVFEPYMGAGIAERGRIERIVRQALGTGMPRPGGGLPGQTRGSAALSAVYQPVFDAATDDLVGFEALARLVDRDGVGIPPSVFIPILENSGLIRQLGVLMLNAACDQLACWRERMAGLGALTMSVNVSAMQAGHGSLPDDVHRALTGSGLAPADLVLELTETTLLQATSDTVRRLRDLRGEGVGIAIDDFGTGYSSLQYLATLPASALKIDKSFAAGLATDAICRKIVAAVAGLAVDLGLDCVVEGIETELQRAALPAGVRIQGYLTGVPTSPDQLDFPELLGRGLLPAGDPTLTA